MNSSGLYTGGPYAGIWVEGNNRVWITGSTVFVGTVDYPVIVTNPWVTADSRIFLSNTLAGGTPGFVYVSSRSAGSFTVTSSSPSDTSRIAWMIVS